MFRNRFLRRAGLLAALFATIAVSTGCMQRYSLSGAVGHPWGIAFDAGGNLWFAEAGCDLAPGCGGNQRPGQIGLIPAGSATPQFYTLPATAGNQPIFVAVDATGKIWFTTPNNDRIGRFDPATRAFEQWPVTPGSGPWHLAFSSDGSIWYTEHFASAIGRFDPATLTHGDFKTPSSNSQPYGIAVEGTRIWFTENASGVGRIGMLDAANGNRISEYIVRASPSNDLTPHMITLDSAGNVWFTEGFERELGELTPSRAIPSECGRRSGTCRGVAEYDLPPPACGLTHGSGIVAKGSAHEIWFTDSLSGEVGVINTITAQVVMHRLRDCGVHAHDGLAVDAGGSIWWAEQFSNEIVRFLQEP